MALGSDTLTDLHLSVDEQKAFESRPDLVRVFPPQLYLADQPDDLARIGKPHPRDVSDRVESVSWAPDGTRLAFLEFRGPHRDDNLWYWVWEEHIATKRRHLVTGLPGDSWWFGSLTYSPDSRWLLVENGQGDTRLLQVASGLELQLPTRYASASWHPASGTACLLMIERAEFDLRLSIIDLITGKVEDLGTVRSPNGLAFRFMQPQVSPDGAFLAGVTRAGWDPSRLERLGGAPHLGVIDLETLRLSLPLPISFNTPAVDRSHSAPRWLEQPRPQRPFEVADRVQARMRPSRTPEPDWQENLDRHARYAAIQFCCMKACSEKEDELGSPGWMLEEGLGYAEHLLSDGLTEGIDAFRAGLTAERLAEGLRIRDDHLYDDLLSRACEYYRLSISMGHEVKAATQCLARLEGIRKEPSESRYGAEPLTDSTSTDGEQLADEGVGETHPKDLLVALLPKINMGYILEAACSAHDAVHALVHALKVTAISQVDARPDELASYTIIRDVDYGWTGALVPFESLVDGGSLILFWATGGLDGMAALGADLRSLDIRSLTKRVKGKWYGLAKSRIAEGTADMTKMLRERNPLIQRHEISDRLSTYVPVEVGLDDLPQGAYPGQAALSEDRTRLGRPRATDGYVYESSSWRNVGKVDADGYVSESSSWRTVGRVDADGYVSESSSWRTVGRVDADGYVYESSSWRNVGKVDADGYVSESSSWRTVGRVDAPNLVLSGGAALLLLL